jgi:hypothetical protein
MEKSKMDSVHSRLALWQGDLSKPRYRDSRRLLQAGYRVYSQNDEDGIIHEIFRRIGTTDRRFIEIGVGNGLENNTLHLLALGWSGVWFEASQENVAKIKANVLAHLPEGALHVSDTLVHSGNVDDQISSLASVDRPDLLSIDVDGCDYWVWNALSCVRPRVVVVEYNATWHPPLCVTVPDVPSRAWNGTSYFGTSLGALEKLGRSKGYNLVGCCYAGVNAFFVAEEECGDLFEAPFTAENHYEPARYHAVPPPGHRAGFGPLVTV